MINMTAKEKNALKGIRIGTENEIVRNRFSGVAVELTPEAVAIYDVIIGSEIWLNKFPEDEARYNLFYTARDVFIKNWPDAYMILLD
jgi:hypothetical protein